MTVGMLLETLGIGLVIPAILILIKGKEGLLEIGFFEKYKNLILEYSTEEIIIFGLFLILTVYFFKYLFLIFLYFTQFKFSAKVLKRITNKIFKNYLYKPYSFYLDVNSSKLINSLINQVNIFVDQALEATMTITTELLILTGIIVFLIYIDPNVVLLVLLIISLPTILFYLVVKKKAKRWGHTRLKYEELNLKNIQQTLMGIKEVKIFNKEKLFFDIFFKNVDITVDTRRKMLILNQLPRVWLEALAILSIVILIYFLFARADTGIAISILGLYVAAAFRLMPSMNRIILASQNLRYGHAATQRIFEELQTLKNNVSENNNGDIISEKFNSLQLKNISFSYSEKAHIFNNINFEIKKGDFIGILGETGSGKSTLIDLLTGLINPSSGKIICNNKYEINNHTVSWQNKIGYAPQMFNLLDDTIENNISFDDSSKKDTKALQESIKISALENFIEANPDKLKSIVGERGIQISGGQRQRIIIARALYKKPEILILDEATNALDSSTEQKIITNLCEKKGADITIIMVTHRESSLKKCNKILRVKNNKITIENN